MKRSALVLLLLAAAAHIAQADEAKDRAKSSYQAGVKAYAAQNFVAAAADFDEAYKAVQVPEVAFSAAQAYRRLYRLDANPAHVRRAIELYKAYLEQVKSGGRVGDAADSLGEMQRELDRLGAAGRVTTSAAVVEHTQTGVNVSISDRTDTAAMKEVGDATGELVKGLAVTIDGKPTEPFALVDVPAGDHTLAVSADGYFPAQKVKRVVQGEHAFVDLELKPKPATIAIAAEDGAAISVDGRVAEATKIDVPAGHHFILVTHRGREPFAREVDVTRGEVVKLDAPLPHTQKRKVLPFVIGGSALLGAATLLTIAGAAGTDAEAQKALTAIEAKGNATPADADKYKQDVKRRDSLVMGAWFLGATTVAIGLVAAGLYYFDTPSSEGLHLAPVVAPGTTGAVLVGRF